MRPNEVLIYEEQVSSNLTEALFVFLTIFFCSLLIWQMNAGSQNLLTAVFLILSLLFLFYSVNYRTLKIGLTRDALKLTFGIFTWTIGLDNIETCSLDHLPLMMKYGGAGIHFMRVHKRYRASFNFLEFPRIVIALKNKAGPVRDISFSTRQPDELLRFIQEAISSPSFAQS